MHMNQENDDNFAQLAIDHWRATLADPDASDSAKSSAANGLAAYDRQRQERARGTIHRLSRAELTQEIERVKSKLGHKM